MIIADCELVLEMSLLLMVPRSESENESHTCHKPEGTRVLQIELFIDLAWGRSACAAATCWNFGHVCSVAPLDGTRQFPLRWPKSLLQILNYFAVCVRKIIESTWPLVWYRDIEVEGRMRRKLQLGALIDWSSKLGVVVLALPLTSGAPEHGCCVGRFAKVAYSWRRQWGCWRRRRQCWGAPFSTPRAEPAPWSPSPALHAQLCLVHSRVGGAVQTQ
jgi:hypothetical protein